MKYIFSNSLNFQCCLSIHYWLTSSWYYLNIPHLAWELVELWLKKSVFYMYDSTYYIGRYNMNVDMISFKIIFKCLFFNWRIISLQCCVRFCCTTMWTSHKCTHIPSSWASFPSPFYPSRSSQSTRLSFLCFTATSH